MNIGIIGAGLIGKKRADAIEEDDKVTFVCDIDEVKAKNLASRLNCNFTTDYKSLLNENIDIVIVSTINNSLMPITVFMLNDKKHVLCEKPLGCDSKESSKIINAAKLNSKFVKTGFNHRFHPAIMETKKLINSGKMGDIINIRCRYGHGGRKGMEKEWRCSKSLSGGGELLDQGVHLVDLTRWFLNREIDEVYGQIFTSFWDIEVEDNAFFQLKSNDVLVQGHVSWTNWKNIFSYEIFFKEGYIIINGLGGSYGTETLEVGHRNINGGRPDIKKYYYEEDNSWNLEWKNFKNGIEYKTDISGSGIDGHKVNKIIDAIYDSNKRNKPIVF